MMNTTHNADEINFKDGLIFSFDFKTIEVAPFPISRNKNLWSALCVLPFLPNLF